MCKLKIGNKYGVRHVEILIEDRTDAKTMLEILAKNGIPATLYTTEKENEE